MCTAEEYERKVTTSKKVLYERMKHIQVLKPVRQKFHFHNVSKSRNIEIEIRNRQLQISWFYRWWGISGLRRKLETAAKLTCRELLIKISCQLLKLKPQRENHRITQISSGPLIKYQYRHAIYDQEAGKNDNLCRAIYKSAIECLFNVQRWETILDRSFFRIEKLSFLRFMNFLWPREWWRGHIDVGDSHVSSHIACQLTGIRSSRN